MEMRDREGLRGVLKGLEGRGYPGYRAIRGRWDFPGFVLHVDHVQGDPFAAPSRLRVELSPAQAGLPREECAPRSRAEGVADLLARGFAHVAGQGRGRGSGGSGRIRMEAPGQQVLSRTAVRVAPDGSVEARFTVGLPARGRRILGREAAELLCDEVPRLVAATLVGAAWEPSELRLHARTNEDAVALREQLAHRGLVAFVADGALLPRRSGVDDRPLTGAGAIPFRSPASLRVELDRPNAGPVTGMGIPRGVTLIVGGGFHGKSTLLRALERGVYNHRPGDGREAVVTDATAVKVRAEDGRSVASVDISPFVGPLPGGIDTRSFTSQNASGSTSQAAAIMEALEAGARVLLVDEDTAATNLMIRDRRMQALVPREREPITPLIDRVRELSGRGVSSVLVLGGSGDYLDVADTVVAMHRFLPEDVTERAREVARSLPTGRASEVPSPMQDPAPRVPLPHSVDPSRGRRAVSTRVRREDAIQFGEEEIDLSGVDQLVSVAQARGVARALVLARERFMDGRRTVPEILDEVMALLESVGLDPLTPGREGDVAGFRRFELAAALNRLRGLEVRR